MNTIITRLPRWNRLCFCLIILLASGMGLPPVLVPQSRAAESEAELAGSSNTGLEDTSKDDESEQAFEEEDPWDYSPYRVLVWIVSRNPRYSADHLRKPVLDYLDRDFHALWRTTVEDAPASVATAAYRSMEDLTFDRIAASDPVIAVKRDHDDAVRIQSVRTLPRYIDSLPVTSGLRDSVLRRAEEFGDPLLGGTADRFRLFDGDSMALAATWPNPNTEAILVTRGQATKLEKPGAKLLQLPITGLVGSAVEQYDKIYVVRIDDSPTSQVVEVTEMETLMRVFGGVFQASYLTLSDLPNVVGYAVKESFSPVVRIDDAGQKTAMGMVRGVNLIMDPQSPGHVPVGSALQPMLRKDDRNGKPIGAGPIEWAYLIATEKDGPEITMDYYSGRAGGLQGRKNKRTHKIGVLIKPRLQTTLLRLHSKGREDLPLIGYELYERELKSKNMTFVGRTDWDGRLTIEKSDAPMRLLYVKNGGAVLARLPVVPGFTQREIADLEGDDMRLQAEAYVRGVQNAIVDLVAIRKLLAARIRMRLRKGQMKDATELLEALSKQPTNEQLAADMDKKQGMFLKEIGKNIAQRAKVDQMFKETREMLGKQINPAIIRDLELDVQTAKENGGKLPPEPEAPEKPPLG